MIVRTYFLYARNRYVMIFPAVVWLGAVSLFIADRVYIAGLHNVSNEFFINDVEATKVIDPLRLAYYSLSMAVNTILLTFIAWKGWYAALHLGHSPIHYQGDP
jgi:hypothetical protein